MLINVIKKILQYFRKVDCMNIDELNQTSIMSKLFYYHLKGLESRINPEEIYYGEGSIDEYTAINILDDLNIMRDLIQSMIINYQSAYLIKYKIADDIKTKHKISHLFKVEQKDLEKSVAIDYLNIKQLEDMGILFFDKDIKKVEDLKVDEKVKIDDYEITRLK